MSYIFNIEEYNGWYFPTVNNQYVHHNASKKRIECYSTPSGALHFRYLSDVKNIIDYITKNIEPNTGVYIIRTFENTYFGKL